MSVIPLPRSGLPAFEPLLNGALWQRWVEDRRVFPLADLRAAVRYLRLKPGTSCRIAVFTGSGPLPEPPVGFLLHLFADPDHSRVAWKKVTSRPQRVGLEGYEPFHDQDQAVVALPFPIDPEVPGLRHLFRRHRLRQSLQTMLVDYPHESWDIVKEELQLRLLAYKPGRRAVLRVETPIEHRSRHDVVRLPLLLKIGSPEAFEAHRRPLVTIASRIPDDAGWGVPTPRGAAADRFLWAAEWVEGVPLASVARTARGPEAFRSTGSALAGLHGLNADLPDAATTLDAGSLLALGADLAGVIPGAERPIRTLADSLARRVTHSGTEGSATVHGDFHVDQVLLAGDRVVLVDLDRAGRGDRHADLGAFLAHTEESDLPLECRDAFLRGYTEAGGVAPDPGALAAARAAALFRRSIFPFRTLLPDWPMEIRRRLYRIDQLLHAGNS